MCAMNPLTVINKQSSPWTWTDVFWPVLIGRTMASVEFHTIAWMNAPRNTSGSLSIWSWILRGFFCILINLLLSPKVVNPYIQLHDFLGKSKPGFRKLGAGRPFGCMKKAFEAEDYSLKPFTHWCIRQGDTLWNLKARTPVRVKVCGDSWWPVGNHVVLSKWWVTEKETNKQTENREE